MLEIIHVPLFVYTHFNLFGFALLGGTDGSGPGSSSTFGSTLNSSSSSTWDAAELSSTDWLNEWM